MAALPESNINEIAVFYFISKSEKEIMIFSSLCHHGLNKSSLKLSANMPLTSTHHPKVIEQSDDQLLLKGQGICQYCHKFPF